MRGGVLRVRRRNASRCTVEVQLDCPPDPGTSCSPLQRSVPCTRTRARSTTSAPTARSAASAAADRASGVRPGTCGGIPATRRPRGLDRRTPGLAGRPHTGCVPQPPRRPTQRTRRQRRVRRHPRPGRCRRPGHGPRPAALPSPPPSYAAAPTWPSSPNSSATPASTRPAATPSHRRRPPRRTRTPTVAPDSAGRHRPDSTRPTVPCGQKRCRAGRSLPRRVTRSLPRAGNAE
jgi:hypothetical protein